MATKLLTLESPVGTYVVEDQGAGVHAVLFKAKRARKFKVVGVPRSMRAALERISEHEGDLLEPSAPRERGENGPVSIFAVGKRTTQKTPTKLDREIAELVAKL